MTSVILFVSRKWSLTLGTFEVAEPLPLFSLRDGITPGHILVLPFFVLVEPLAHDFIQSGNKNKNFPSAKISM